MDQKNRSAQAHQPTPDPIAECHRLGITITTDSSDTQAALHAWETAEPEETLRVLTACVETVTGLGEDVLAIVLPTLWGKPQDVGPQLRRLLQPHAIDYIAREMAAEYALAANRRMELQA